MSSSHLPSEPSSRPSQPLSANRLIRESSPYLLAHAHNPVDWYPWGDEAFAKAAREDKPIFLSIGYYTCHWCHVMERESFENAAVAEILNRDYVSIKVDREERPDIDRVYMTFVQATTGSGGWPMSVFLTPDRRPFWGGTYFPPDDRYGRPGFATLLRAIGDSWRQDRRRVLDAAGDITRALQNLAAGASATGAQQAPGAEASPNESLDRLFVSLERAYDPDDGGFGGAPKFPRASTFNFLMRYHHRTGNAEALRMVLHTLDAMAAGGMHDQLGGGFHRYSVDSQWLVPHFEKMLYDQAQLAAVYLDAWQISGRPEYSSVVRTTLDFVLRELTSPEGGFYSALDADSPKPETAGHGPRRELQRSAQSSAEPESAEGAFYLWTAGEIEAELGEDAGLFSFIFGVEPGGNVPPQYDQHGEMRGTNILHHSHGPAQAAQKFSRSEAEVVATLARARQKLFEARARRPRPPLDDKVITAWNGLMISAFARAGQALVDERYLAAAQAAARCIRARLDSGGRLLRRLRQGDAGVDAFADDYAFLIQGLLDLFSTDSDLQWLDWALDLQLRMDQLFLSPDGGYFSTPADDALVLVRMRDEYDGAEPAASSVAALNLMRLAQLLGGSETGKALEDRASGVLRAYAPRLRDSPEAVPQMAVAALAAQQAPLQVVVAGRRGAADTQSLLRAVHRRFLPNATILFIDNDAESSPLLGRFPYLRVGREGADSSRSAAYVCRGYACQLPVTSAQELEEALSAESD
jgi:uncharacterized protein YyaL (SSP411 family)